MQTNLRDLEHATLGFKASTRMPVLFVGHGNPMNVLYDSPFTRSLAATARSLKERPAAVLVVSAHWLTRDTRVTVTTRPKTIHDFSGFPDELYAIDYPAPGAPEAAREARRLITSTTVGEDGAWGLDHGAWTILKHMFPEAEIPVFQLSVAIMRPPEFHFSLAGQLKALRDKGVLIIGSGNLVHNLFRVDFSETARPFDWAMEFDELVKSKLAAGAFADLVRYDAMGPAARLAVPTNDHYLPMLYTLGLAWKDEDLTFTYEEIQNASISMRSFRIGDRSR